MQVGILRLVRGILATDSVTFSRAGSGHLRTALCLLGACKSWSWAERRGGRTSAPGI